MYSMPDRSRSVASRLTSHVCAYRLQCADLVFDTFYDKAMDKAQAQQRRQCRASLLLIIGEFLAIFFNNYCALLYSTSVVCAMCTVSCMLYRVCMSVTSNN